MFTMRKYERGICLPKCGSISLTALPGNQAVSLWEFTCTRSRTAACRKGYILRSPLTGLSLSSSSDWLRILCPGLHVVQTSFPALQASCMLRCLNVSFCCLLDWIVIVWVYGTKLETALNARTFPSPDLQELSTHGADQQRLQLQG